MTRSFTAIATVIAIALTPTRGLARVTRIEIDSREDILAGQVFGSVGAYEKIIGRVYFAFDPANRMNSRIVDLDKASINEQGLIEAWADFVVLRPKRPVAGGGIGLLEVSNRGGKASLRYFNGGGRTLDPATAEDFGDGLLMRLGLTVIWIGWQHDVPIREGLLRLHVPTALDNGAHITGLVRSDWTLDTAAQTLALGHRANVAYPVADPNDPENVLTVRDGRMAPRRTVPRNEWRFARGGESGVIDDRTHIYKETGFEAGMIYELVYRAQDPRMVGLGLAAIRDMMSYAKYDARSPFPVEHGIAIGISQTGRFLRHFVYQGFNTDEGGRMVFDGLMIHTAGAGRGKV